jgi:signal transduction histidine kinase
VAALAAAYFAAGKLGLQLAFLNPSATAVWAPTGLALAAGLLFGYRVWPGILLGAFLVNVTTSGMVWPSLAIAAGNTLEGLAGTFLVNEYAGGRRAFQRGEDVARFAVLAGVVSPVIAASSGVATLAAAGLADPARLEAVWVTWWLGDATGALIVAPLVVVLADMPWGLVRARPAWETGLLLAVLALTGLAAFGGWFPLSAENYPLGFVLLPLVVWAAVRYDQHGAVMATATLSALALWGTLAGHGPFAGGPQHEALLLLQGFMGTVALTGLCLAAVAAERRQAEARLRRLNAELEQRIAERTAELSASNARLEGSQAELRQLSGHLLRAREAERAAVAREIHDELGQALTGLKMDLAQLERAAGQLTAEAARARIRGIQAAIDSNIETVRRIASSLRPPILDDFGLAAALEWQVGQWQARTGLEARFESEAEHVDLSAEAATALFRACQEALTNVARHAQATRVTVRLAREAGGLVMTVEDDGRGITEAALLGGRSLGLLGMRERVQLVGGRVIVGRGETGGTVVRVEIGNM